MTTQEGSATWKAAGALAGRLIFVAVFLLALAFKLIDIEGTANLIAAQGFPIPKALAWLAAAFEFGVALCLLTGAFFSEAALLAAVYVLFLAFAFHGPAQWGSKPAEVGLFVDHFSFIAGLLFAAVYGPGRLLTIHVGFLSPERPERQSASA